MRQHAGLTQRLEGAYQGERLYIGRCATGAVYEQTVTLQDPETDETLRLRRISIMLDKPVRGGQSELHLLTNVPVADPRAEELVVSYRQPWKI